MSYIKQAWASASDPVRIAIVVTVAALVIVGIVYGVDVIGVLGQ